MIFLLTEKQLKTIIKEALSDDVMKRIEAEADALIAKSKEDLNFYQKNIDFFEKEPVDDRTQRVLNYYRKMVEITPSEKNKTNLINSLIRDYEMADKYERARQAAQKEREEKLKTATISRENLIDVFIGAIEGASNYWMDFVDTPNEIKKMVSSGVSYAEACGEYVLNGNDLFIYDPVDVEDSWESYKKTPAYKFNDSMETFLQKYAANTEPLGVINMDSLLQAIKLSKKYHPDVYENIVLDELSGEDCDVFIQLAAFGEIVFG